MSKTFFTEAEQQQIVSAIANAERNTSGEIRLHIEAKCEGDAYEQAKAIFEKLGMQHTEQKNGVLFYVAYSDRKMAILGDSGIHQKVSQGFWDEEKSLLLDYFKRDKYAEGLCMAIEQAGNKLKEHFPYHDDDTNELNNDISFGEDKPDA